MVNTDTHTIEKISRILDTVKDPEIPVLTVNDLGIIRKIEITEEEYIITITPTYSSCPAMNIIELQIRMVLKEHGIFPIKINTILSPAWTTDWISEEGKKKLKAYGIAPPENGIGKRGLFSGETSVKCPNCNSTDTVLSSQFASTACKALFRCNNCGEPFEYFKCH